MCSFFPVCCSIKANGIVHSWLHSERISHLFWCNFSFISIPWQHRDAQSGTWERGASLRRRAGKVKRIEMQIHSCCLPFFELPPASLALVCTFLMSLHNKKKKSFSSFSFSHLSHPSLCSRKRFARHFFPQRDSIFSVCRFRLRAAENGVSGREKNLE